MNEEQHAGIDARRGVGQRFLRRIVDVHDGEVRALLWSCVYFFCLLTSYSILRPLREQMGLAGGKANLPWLFTGTMVGMFIANPIFSALVHRYPRRRFIPWVYRFFVLNLLVFYLLLRTVPRESVAIVSGIFFVWVSVTNLFAISIFWSFMADLYRLEQGKRLFGFIAVGGSLGAIAGAGLTALLAPLIGPIQLLLVSMLFLELGVQSVRRLNRARSDQRSERMSAADEADREEAAVLGASAPHVTAHGAFNGILLVLRSRYLQIICLYTFCYTLSSTFVYFLQAHIVDAAITDPGRQAALFARIDLSVNILAALTQIFLTGRIVASLGIGFTLISQPILALVAFACLGFSPTLGVLVVFQVLLRAANFATAKPARETLFTVVGRDIKYKSKSFIDTFVYRIGDTFGAWAFNYQQSYLQLGLQSIALLALPIALVWGAIGLKLGREQEVLARDDTTTRGLAVEGESAA